MTIQLEPHWLDIVKAILKENIPHQDVLLFGSRITEHFKPHSDIDLCVMSDQPMALMTLAALREAFSESDLPVRVDIVDWATLTPEFRHVIKEHHFYLQTGQTPFPH